MSRHMNQSHEEVSEMTIAVGTDTTAAADLAVRDAARLAQDRGVELLVLYVRPPGGEVRSIVDPGRAVDPSRYLQGMPSRFPEVAVRTRIVEGDAAERICEVAAEEHAEAIVVGNRGTHGSSWRVRDSVPNLILRHAPCSVTIVDTRRAQ